jgi:crotonobetainyl-CoA:carnitine CoA-transferase CaiB-like acyl-CoA transferase
VQTSLLEAQIALCDFQAARYLIDGDVPPQAGNDHPYAAPMGVMQTQDGYINLAVGNDRQWQSLCRALDLPGLADHPDYATQNERSRNRPALMQVLAPVFRARTSAELLGKLEASDVPAGPIYRMDEVFADPQVQHLGIAQTVHHPVRGRVKLVGEPVTLSRTPAAITAPVPDKGAHTDEVLAEAGFSGDEIAHLRQTGVI